MNNDKSNWQYFIKQWECVIKKKQLSWIKSFKIESLIVKRPGDSCCYLDFSENPR